MLPDCLGTLSSTLCQISALKEAIGQYVCESLTLVVVPCLDNIFMVLLISALAKIGATKPIFLDSGSPKGGGGGGGSCVRGRGLLSLILHSSYTKFNCK